MAVIDHLVYFVPELASGIRWFEELTGVRPEAGGRHDGLGTHNALVSLGGCYLELIAPDPEQPDVGRPRPFGIDARTDSQLVTFAVRPAPGETIDDLAASLARAGHDPGPVVEMSRRTPTGETLSWRLTMPGGDDDAIPFLIDWGRTPPPNTTAVPGPDLVELVVTRSPDRPIVDAYDALGLAGPPPSSPRIASGNGRELRARLGDGADL